MHDVICSHCYDGHGEDSGNKNTLEFTQELSAFDSDIVQEITYDLVWYK